MTDDITDNLSSMPARGPRPSLRTLENPSSYMTTSFKRTVKRNSTRSTVHESRALIINRISGTILHRDPTQVEDNASIVERLNLGKENSKPGEYPPGTIIWSPWSAPNIDPKASKTSTSLVETTHLGNFQVKNRPWIVLYLLGDQGFEAARIFTRGGRGWMAVPEKQRAHLLPILNFGDVERDFTSEGLPHGRAIFTQSSQGHDQFQARPFSYVDLGQMEERRYNYPIRANGSIRPDGIQIARRACFDRRFAIDAADPSPAAGPEYLSTHGHGQSLAQKESEHVEGSGAIINPQRQNEAVTIIEERRLPFARSIQERAKQLPSQHVLTSTSTMTPSKTTRIPIPSPSKPKSRPRTRNYVGRGQHPHNQDNRNFRGSQNDQYGQEYLHRARDDWRSEFRGRVRSRSPDRSQDRAMGYPRGRQVEAEYGSANTRRHQSPSFERGRGYERQQSYRGSDLRHEWRRPRSPSPRHEGDIRYSPGR